MLWNSSNNSKITITPKKNLGIKKPIKQQTLSNSSQQLVNIPENYHEKCLMRQFAGFDEELFK